MRSKYKNVCVKLINGKPFIYSWEFRPKYIRTSRKKQRFKWTYIGPFNSKQTKRFLHSLPIEKQIQLQQQYLEKRAYYEQLTTQMELLGKKEPFKTEKEAILKINNRINREKKLLHHKKKLQKEASRQLAQAEYNN
ncbi:hypothetical protein FOA22_03310 [Heyndrickxia oleronia]|uniref:hypothetical protein n=1 Tax=Heyndrickxia oleronia TaxID=38875 RepID=UPI000717192D